jgi:hypothetical protein
MMGAKTLEAQLADGTARVSLQQHIVEKIIAKLR